MGRKVTIVIEELEGPEGNRPFNVYMEGVDRSELALPADKQGTAVFWGSRLFKICQNALDVAGAIKSVKPRPKGH